MAVRCGGMTGLREANEEIQELCNNIRSEVEGKTNKSYGSFTAKVYATQTVAGINYFIKVDTGDEHLHLRIYRNLKGEHSLTSVQEGKSLEDALEYF